MNVEEAEYLRERVRNGDSIYGNTKRPATSIIELALYAIYSVLVTHEYDSNAYME